MTIGLVLAAGLLFQIAPAVSDQGALMPPVRIGRLQVTLTGLETAETWKPDTVLYSAKKGTEYLIVRYRLKGPALEGGVIDMVELFDARGTRLQTVEALETKKTSLGIIFQFDSNFAVTRAAAFVAKKGTQLGKCKVAGIEFDLANVVPVPQKEP